jgi:UDP-2,3-diacylglucosamine pyrophosphatase LpxH
MPNLILHEQVAVISDLHVADPLDERLDDFTRDDDFERLLKVLLPARAEGPSTLVINGDFIDFAQVLPEFGRHSAGERFGVTEDRSVTKFERVLKGHPIVFRALGEFIGAGNQVIVLPGNHDIDLHWTEVFKALRNALGGPDDSQLVFAKGGELHEQRIHIEHGNQYSYDNWFEHWTDPILDAPDKRRRLERPWGTLFLDLVYNDIEDLYPFVNKVYPHSMMARIALRSFFDDERVSISALARLAAFLITKGKRFALGRLLGDKKSPGAISLYEALARFDLMLAEIVPDAAPARQREVAMELATILPPPHPHSRATRKGVRAGLLGRTDSRGMKKRQRDLLEQGDTTIVAFGHTHRPVDGNARPLWGLEDPRRAFNTGTWMPIIPIGEEETPRWGELSARQQLNDLRYLFISLGSTPTATLEKL